MTFYLDDLEEDVLLALSWAMPLTTTQLHRMVAPTLSRRGLTGRLQGLEAEGLIGHVYDALLIEAGKPPRKRDYIWEISPKGYAPLPDDRRRPTPPSAIRRVLIRHDLMVGDLLSLVVARERERLSGLLLDREVRLDREQPRPRCDAILSIRQGPPALGGLPWQNDPPGVRSERISSWAVEVDRGTEGLGVIREKALAYQARWNDPGFYRRYGKMPIPVWIAPDAPRVDAIMRTWAEAWPEGRWYITTDAKLPELFFVEWNAGRQRAVGLLDGRTA